MLAALTIAGLPVRAAGATKNVLAGVMNGAAVLIFAFSHDVAWLAAAIVGAGAIAGGLVGAALLQRVNEKALADRRRRARPRALRRPALARRVS